MTWQLIHQPVAEAADAWAALDDVLAVGGNPEAAEVLAYVLGSELPDAVFNRIKVGQGMNDARFLQRRLLLAGV